MKAVRIHGHGDASVLQCDDIDQPVCELYKVILEVYDINGRIISKLIDNNMKAGYHSVIWNAESHSSGVYFIKMVAGGFSDTKKVMLLK